MLPLWLPAPQSVLMPPFPFLILTPLFISMFHSPSHSPLRDLWWQEDPSHQAEVSPQAVIVPELSCTRVLRSTWPTWPERMARLVCWGPCARPAPHLFMMKDSSETLSPFFSPPTTLRRNQMNGSKDTSLHKLRARFEPVKILKNILLHYFSWPETVLSCTLNAQFHCSSSLMRTSSRHLQSDRSKETPENSQRNIFTFDNRHWTWQKTDQDTGL